MLRERRGLTTVGPVTYLLIVLAKFNGDKNR